SATERLHERPRPRLAVHDDTSSTTPAGTDPLDEPPSPVNHLSMGNTLDMDRVTRTDSHRQGDRLTIRRELDPIRRRPRCRDLVSAHLERRPSTHVERARRLPEVVPDAEPLTTERIRRELALQSQNRFRRRPRRERRISLRPLLPVVRISISISAELDPRRIAQRPRPRLSAHPGESLRRVIRSRWRADEDRQPEQAGVHRRELSVE